MLGTLAGVLIFGTIQQRFDFRWRLNSWWLRIAIGGLLLAIYSFPTISYQNLDCKVQTDVDSNNTENDSTV